MQAFFGADLEKYADRLAAVDDCGASISYAQLAKRADEFGAELNAGRGLVLLEASNTVDWLVAYVALLRKQRPFLITPAGDRSARRGMAAKFEISTRLLFETGYRPEVKKGPHWPVHVNLAFMLSTSGTTGSLKCVKLSFQNIHSNAQSICEYLGINESDIGAVNLPTHYSYGISIVNSHLFAGAAMAFTNKSVIEKGFWDFLRENCVTSFAGVPHHYELLSHLDLPSKAPPSLQYFTQAGGRLPPHLARNYAELANDHGWRFFIMYGQTEASPRIAYLPSDAAVKHFDCIGQAIPGGRLALVDESGQLIDECDRVGELAYSGPNVMMGYATEPSHLTLGHQTETLYTGDLAELTQDGYYRITGRISRFIKPFGIRIGLDDVEKMMGDSGFSGVATGTDELLIIATTDAEKRSELEDLIHIRLQLPRSHFIIVALDEYPFLPSGKIDYQCIQRFSESRLNGQLEQVGQRDDEMSDDESKIARIWTEVLSVSSVKRSDTFFDLGGDSLSAISVMLQMEKAGIPEAISRQILEGRSVAEIAAQQGGAQVSLAPALQSVTSNAINFTRGLLVLLVIGAHWGPFVLERLGAFGAAFTEWTWPIFRFGTPGFAMVFGLGIGYFWSPMVANNRPRLIKRIQLALVIVATGSLVIALLRIANVVISTGASDAQWPTLIFYDVLLFYIIAVLTIYPILLIVMRADYPVLAAIAIMIGSLGLSQAFQPLLESEAVGFAKLGIIMLSSNYSYPLMMAYVLIGMAIGLWIKLNNERLDLARVAAWGGGCLFCGGIVLSIGTGLQMRWFVGLPTLPAIVTYSGALLLAFAAAFSWQRRREGAQNPLFRIIAVLGILALPAYVAHAAAFPLKELIAIVVPSIIAVIVVVTFVFALLFFVGKRVYRLYFSSKIPALP